MSLLSGSHLMHALHGGHLTINTSPLSTRVHGHPHLVPTSCITHLDGLAFVQPSTQLAFTRVVISPRERTFMWASTRTSHNHRAGTPSCSPLPKLVQSTCGCAFVQPCTQTCSTVMRAHLRAALHLTHPHSPVLHQVPCRSARLVGT